MKLNKIFKVFLATAVLVSSFGVFPIGSFATAETSGTTKSSGKS